jgi:hypothetical protein
MTDRKTAIHEAALKLDHTNDDHWTKGGDPALDDLKALTGLDDLTRSEVNEATWLRRGNLYQSEGEGGENVKSDIDGNGLMTLLANDPEVQEIMVGLVAAGRTEYHFSETKDVTVIQFTAPDGTPMIVDANGLIYRDLTSEKAAPVGDCARETINVERDAYEAIIAERDELKAALEDEAQQRNLYAVEADQLRSELNLMMNSEVAGSSLAEGEAIALLEAFVKASGHERYRRNSQIQAIAQSYRVQQKQIKEHQDRIDKREADRVAARQTAQG